MPNGGSAPTRMADWVRIPDGLQGNMARAILCRALGGSDRNGFGGRRWLLHHAPRDALPKPDEDEFTGAI